MHLGLTDLRAFLEANRQAPSLVLATVTATEGSTYRKPGAMLLANAAGDFAGLISGGCLEHDLVSRARDVAETGIPLPVRYDLRDDEDLVLGLGLGCGGAIHLLLQRLDAADDFHPLGPMFSALDRGDRCRLGLVVEAAASVPALGSAALVTERGQDAGASVLLDALRERRESEAPGHRNRRWQRIRLAGGAGEMLAIDIEPTPHVLVCGAGPDALPVVRQVLALGWACTVTDHRPASLEPARLPDGASGLCVRPDRLSEALDLGRVDAAVVMSHHVDHDADYLRQLTARPPAYLGLLGPRVRKAQLLDQIDAPELHIHGPVGLDIGAELPEAIALAVMAEIHAVLNRRSGVSLDPPRRRLVRDG